MFDFGSGELVVIGVVALVAIGPKELPGLLRTIGQAVGKLRRMAGDFQSQFNDAMREADMADAQKMISDIKNEFSPNMMASGREFTAVDGSSSTSDTDAPHEDGTKADGSLDLAPIEAAEPVSGLEPHDEKIATSADHASDTSEKTSDEPKPSDESKTQAGAA